MNFTLQEKYPEFENSAYLKALLSQDDIEITPIQYIEGNEIEPRENYSFIEKANQIVFE